jgi:colanic acid/amylovoran biosynthesis glycosyltransferase
MGILFIADDIESPSTLWMRRMFRGIERDVVEVALLRKPSSFSIKNSRVVALEQWWQGQAKKVLGLMNRNWSTSLDLHLPIIKRAIHRRDVSVIFIHYATLAVRYASLLQKTSKPVFVHCHGHDVCWDLKALGNHGFAPWHASDYQSRVRELPDNVFFIANSQYTQRELLRAGIRPERIKLKYLGVELPPQTIRPEGEELNILYLGRLSECKGPDLTIQAFDKACAMGLSATLTIAGDGPLRYACELLRERSPFREKIKILGSTDEATGLQLRGSADIFTAHNRRGPLNNQEESLGVAYLEAMSHGLPVVTGHSGGIPEFVQDGVTGRLFQPNDLEAHAQILVDLGQDATLRRRLGEQARNYVSQNHSIEQEIAQLRGILTQGLHPSLRLGEIKQAETLRNHASA